MKFIDTVFFKIYKAYKDKFNSDIPTFYAVSYLMIMFVLHAITVMKFLNLVGIEINISQYSKLQKIAVILLIYLVFGIRYYYFFDPAKFEDKHGFTSNYKALITYTAVFFVSFWVLILVF